MTRYRLIDVESLTITAIGTYVVNAGQSSKVCSSPKDPLPRYYVLI